MKFSCDKISLANAVNKVIKGVTPRTTLPILQGILLKSENNKIIMYTTDMEIGIQCSVDASIIEEGSIVVSSKVFSDLVRKLPDDMVFFESDENNTVNIKCGLTEFSISGNSAEEFPDIPEVMKDVTFSLNQKILKEMIKMTSFSVAQDMTRPILTGILMEVSKNAINMVALDGYRMAIKKYVSEDLLSKNLDDFSVVIPGTTANELLRVMEDNDDDVSISFTGNQILFEFNDTKVISKLLDGNYMNYKAVIPKDFKSVVIIDKDDLIGAIDRASLLASNKSNLIKFTFNERELVISSNSEKGKMSERLNIEIEGNLIEIAFNSRYLLEALRVIDSEKIKMSMINSINPMIITPVEDDDYLYMVLPVKLND
ncbi:MAG: DNA polymerase III subunit beta [Thermoanaerobacterium sp.]|nr:DNA polymerase III subunit beta [Thermoanaerobacterium sp.]